MHVSEQRYRPPYPRVDDDLVKRQRQKQTGTFKKKLLVTVQWDSTTQVGKKSLIGRERHIAYRKGIYIVANARNFNFSP